MGHHHRSGPLKQSNKQHKTGRHDSKTTIAKRIGGKVEKNLKATQKVGVSAGKQQRLQKAKSLRGEKKKQLWLRTRTSKKAIFLSTRNNVNISQQVDSKDLQRQLR